MQKAPRPLQFWAALFIWVLPGLLSCQILYITGVQGWNWSEGCFLGQMTLCEVGIWGKTQFSRYGREKDNEIFWSVFACRKYLKAVLHCISHIKPTIQPKQIFYTGFNIWKSDPIFIQLQNYYVLPILKGLLDYIFVQACIKQWMIMSFYGLNNHRWAVMRFAIRLQVLSSNNKSSAPLEWQC